MSSFLTHALFKQNKDRMVGYIKAPHDRRDFTVTKRPDNQYLIIEHDTDKAVNVYVDTFNGFRAGISKSCAAYCRDIACVMFKLQEFVYGLTKEAVFCHEGPCTCGFFGNDDPETHFNNFMYQFEGLFALADDNLKVVEVPSEFVTHAGKIDRSNSHFQFQCRIDTETNTFALEEASNHFWVRIMFQGDPFFHLDFSFVNRFKAECRAAADMLKQHAYLCLQAITLIRNLWSYNADPVKKAEASAPWSAPLIVANYNVTLPELKVVVDAVDARFWSHSYTLAVKADDDQSGEFLTVTMPDFPWSI